MKSFFFLSSEWRKIAYYSACHDIYRFERYLKRTALNRVLAFEKKNNKVFPFVFFWTSKVSLIF